MSKRLERLRRLPARTRGRKHSIGTSAPADRVIFDVGAHSGEDTDFYLNKGFRVIAVEANPDLVLQLQSRFVMQIKSGQLVVINAAVVERAAGPIAFFINDSHDDWSSTRFDIASKARMPVREVLVESTDLMTLVESHGTPYYLKVDIEMGDLPVAASLEHLDSLPRYCSFEYHEESMLSILSQAGYSRFQIVNQWLNGLIQPVVPPREGLSYWPGAMTGMHSGLFGLELPPEDWVDSATALELRRSLDIVGRFGLMRNSWFDIHATLA